VQVTGFPETSVNARHIIEDSTVNTVPPDFTETLQHEERLELWKQLYFCFIFWYLQISYTGGMWGCWEDVRDTRGLSRMEQFVIRDDYDGDTDDDDDGDDDDTNLTTLEAWYSFNNHCTEQEKIQLEAENVVQFIR